MTAECTVTTVDAGEEADYDAAFRLHPVVCKTVMVSDVLHDAVRELCEQPGATSVVFTMSPQVCVGGGEGHGDRLLVNVRSPPYVAGATLSAAHVRLCWCGHD